MRLGQPSLTAGRTGSGPGCSALAETERRDAPTKSTAASVTLRVYPLSHTAEIARASESGNLQGVTAARALLLPDIPPRCASKPQQTD